MGVPAFFRWLTRKYPSVVIECVENKNIDDNGRNVYEDASLPNPNGIEFDNLYLDMNGIIHPCTHPEDKPPPKNEDEMMLAIFDCIDRLFSIVRPRKLLYMAIDGVAPRAKMNQQRSRRFRAAKESIEKRMEIQRIRDELLVKGCILPPEKPKEDHFDSNCITPGTPFMDRLSRCLHYYIHDRMNNNPSWRKIKVILSDANVPGEGEHKIMDYIRKQRSQPDHDPNTQHVLCGADADLIMLGLATHEPNFTIIREEFLPNKPKPCDICGQFGHEMDKCQGLNSIEGNSNVKPDIMVGAEVRFIFVRLNVLREYLKRTMTMPNLPFEYDFERVLDDWVFMCFFVGNDFLPHLPSLEIREGAIDRLIELYKKCVYKTKGYLTDSGEVNLSRVQLIMSDLGLVEDQIFKERQRREEQFKAREKGKKRRLESAPPDFSRLNNSTFAPTPLGRDIKPNYIPNLKQEMINFRSMTIEQKANYHSSGSSDSKQALELMLKSDNDLDRRGRKRNADEMQGVSPQNEEEEDYQDKDEVRLWEDGFKDRYYESKFDVTPDNLAFRYSVALQYVRGLCWVLKYYYQGCASWKWYFPYHYAPFASDFVNITGLSTQFEKGTKPFNPLEQLMGVFPAASSSHVPEPWAKLMSDPKSPIIDFYPEDFKIDLNGKKFAWQGVALLPFVDEKRLFKALELLYDELTPEEKRRNKCGDSRLYLCPENPGFRFVKAQYKNKVLSGKEIPISIQGMQGTILLADDNVPFKGVLTTPIPNLPNIEDNDVITVKFRDPTYADDFIFPAKRLPNAKDPPPVLGPENRNSNYKPVIGFNRNLPTASLSDAGHRMMNHHTGQNSFRQNNFSTVPPPSYGSSNDRRNNYNQGQWHQYEQGKNQRNYSNYNDNKNKGSSSSSSSVSGSGSGISSTGGSSSSHNFSGRSRDTAHNDSKNRSYYNDNARGGNWVQMTPVNSSTANAYRLWQNINNRSQQQDLQQPQQQQNQVEPKQHFNHQRPKMYNHQQQQHQPHQNQSNRSNVGYNPQQGGYYQNQRSNDLSQSNQSRNGSGYQGNGNKYRPNNYNRQYKN